jgi:PKD repeat protein
VKEAKEDHPMQDPKPVRLTSLAAACTGFLAFLLLLQGTALAATRVVQIGTNGQHVFVDSVSGNSTTTINVGDTVMWNWADIFHSTTSGGCPNGVCTPDGTWDSGVRQSLPSTFSFTFTTAGTFPYHCAVHLSLMQGTVIVQQAGTAPIASFTFSPSGPVMGSVVSFTDTSTQTPTSWSWNFGDPASGTNNTSAVQNPTHTFQSAGTFTVTLQATNASGSNTATMPVVVSAGGAVPCVVDSETLCLNGGRFAVTTEWTKPDGTSGHGTGVPLTSDSGYFWFFDPTNIEVVTKVLNGCAINNAYWVFAAGLTNVQVDLRVVDTSTGIVYTNENPQGTAFAPIQNTGAFPSSCP